MFFSAVGETDRARRSDALQPRGDVDAVAHQVAVALFDHVADMDADAKDDAPILGDAGIAFDHGVLHLNGAPNGIDDAAKLDDRAIARSLNNAPVMNGDSRINQIAAQSPQPRQDAIFVCASEPAIADHIRAEDRCKFAGLAHSPCPRPPRLAHSRDQNSSTLGRPQAMPTGR